MQISVRFVNNWHYSVKQWHTLHHTIDMDDTLYENFPLSFVELNFYAKECFDQFFSQYLVLYMLRLVWNLRLQSFLVFFLEAMTQLRLTLTMDQITLQRLTLFKIMVIDTLEKNVSVLTQNSHINVFLMGPQLLVYKFNFWQLTIDFYSTFQLKYRSYIIFYFLLECTFTKIITQKLAINCFTVLFALITAVSIWHKFLTPRFTLN